ncbi:MAG: 2,3-bisphosphoglycerate-independent phosphoglycerate mutase [Holosporaceae bacterium]|jgi:2,3-bisphosphoglycerate-independent phosphoglycerate mutase|nr:2,3-bisphosphoglycerate-independent phosphoglycerate mutase [Holosporaceae bacterium]
MMSKKPLVLCILDGFGFSEKEEYNAVKTAHTPTFDKLWLEYPHTLLKAAGLNVGLPEGQMGNSEVGHTAIGLGRVVYQDLPRITMAIANNTLKDFPELIALMDKLKENKRCCHLWGLLSDGGIHSHLNHLLALTDIMLENKIKVLVHATLDGRDTPPKSTLYYIDMFEKRYGTKAKIATVGGRYYSMDRDKHWDRTRLAYNAMVRPIKLWESAHEYVEKCYSEDVFDEFVPPMAIGRYDGIQDDDALICFNFRSDRVKQMLQAFTDEIFPHFIRPYGMPKLSSVVGMTEYSSEFHKKIGVLFPREEIKKPLGEVIAAAGLTQLRMAETEKYPHVTFFFNGGREQPFKNEERILIGSPKVATYDLEPKMSALKLTDMIVNNLNNDAFDVYVLNFANPDMVGHTGNFKAVVEAIEVIDKCLFRINEAVKLKDGCLIITADHGNAEEMFNPKASQPHTAHTTNDVPFILVCDKYKFDQLIPGRGLSDVAPTVLSILGLDIPPEMTGKSIIV